MGQIKDLTGQRFGRLTVVRRGEDYYFPNGKPGITWFCQCDCGNTKTVLGHSLRNGLTKSCGCLQKGVGEHRKIKPEDMLNKRFGKLIVKSMVPNEESPNLRYDYWLCDCDCGTKDYMVSGVALRRKRGTKSCGCYNSEMSHIKNTVDITGQRYGHLTVIKEHNGEKSPSGSILWECVCDCGNHCVVSSNAMRNSSTMSCGCMASRNEERIQKVLEKYHINFKSQFTFEDLRSPITNWLLKFDFGILNEDNSLNFLLEYDGEQHVYGTRYSSSPEKNKEKNKRMIMYDTLKNRYCLDNKICLFRLDYLDKDKIEEKVENYLKLRRLI